MTVHTQHAAGTPCWLDLMTPDLAAVGPFYRALFGWTYEESGPEFGGYQTAHLGGAPVGGLCPVPGDTIPASWNVYFASDDVREGADCIRRLGGQVSMGPIQVADHGHTLIGTDPSGVVFSLWQADRYAGMGITGVPGAFTWAELHTRDADRARDFYTALLGGTSQPLPEMEYHLLSHGGAETAGIMQMDDLHWPPDLPSYWMVYFGVENTDRAVETAQANGGRLVAGPHDSPYGRLAVLQDPAGATFSVIQIA